MSVIPPTMLPPVGLGLKCSSLYLQYADIRGVSWAQAQVKAFHYLHRRLNQASMPWAYLVYQDRGEEGFVRVGCLLFNRPQCYKVTGWFGPAEWVGTGRAYLTQWELVNLARVWLSEEIQLASSRWFVSNAASRTISAALKHIPRDYLLYYPPRDLNQPWKLRECMTYLHARVFQGTIYKASNFILRRDNGAGLLTYSRVLRNLRREEEGLIEVASKLHKRHRRRRAYLEALQEVSWSPLFTLYPVLGGDEEECELSLVV